MTARLVESFAVLAPRETVRAVNAVVTERARQEAKGYTPEHDDEHTLGDLVTYAISWAEQGNREGLVRAAAVLVAAIESNDRKSSRKSRGPRVGS